MRPLVPAPSPAAHVARQPPPAHAPAVWHAPAGRRPQQDWVACGGAAAGYARPHCRWEGQNRRGHAPVPAPALTTRRLRSGQSPSQLAALRAEAPAAFVCASAAAAPWLLPLLHSKHGVLLQLCPVSAANFWWILLSCTPARAYKKALATCFTQSLSGS